MIIEYHRPERLSDALDLLAREEPLTVPMGGGTVLSQKRKPDFAVVDLQKLGLNQIVLEGQLLEIGAAVTLQQLYEYDQLPESLQASLRKSLDHECSVNLRRASTVAGSLVSCDGRSAFATALLALDARLVWAPSEEIQSLGDFLPLRQPFGRERLMLSVRIPINSTMKIELVARSPLDRPVVCAAVTRWPSGRTRVTLGGQGVAPVLAMDGPEPGGAMTAAQEAYRFSGDAWASAAYRMDVAGRLVRRILAREFSDALDADEETNGRDA